MPVYALTLSDDGTPEPWRVSTVCVNRLPTPRDLRELIRRLADDHDRQSGWLTITEAAARLALPPWTVRRLVDRGALAARHDSAPGASYRRRLRIARVSVDAYAAERAYEQSQREPVEAAAAATVASQPWTQFIDFLRNVPSRPSQHGEAWDP